MDLSTIIGSFLTDGGAGVIVGGLGSLVGNLFKWLNRRQDAKEAEKDRQHELALLDRQAAQEQAKRDYELDKIDTLHDNQIDTIDTQGSWDGLRASYNLRLVDNNCSRWVNNIKALFRPFITTCLLVLVGVILYWLNNSAQELIIGAELAELMEFCVRSVVHISGTAIMWWFGDRAMAQTVSRR